MALVEETIPDLVLMNLRMPRMDGVEATELVRTLHPEVKVVVLTTLGDEYVHQTVRYGAAGNLLKSMRPDALVAAIRAVMMGAVLFAKDVSVKALREVPAEAGDDERVVAGLSP